ncbi:MAG: SRPBCC family protein [Pirellulaceae bacterium]
MIRASGTVCLGGPSETVFAWLADPELVLLWVPQMVANEHSESPSRLGTTFVQRFQYGNRTWTSTGKIVEFVENKRLAIDVAQPSMIVHAAYSLDRVESGTEVRQDVVLELRGVAAYARYVVQPIVSRIARRRIATNLAALKATFERDVGWTSSPSYPIAIKSQD